MAPRRRSSLLLPAVLVAATTAASGCGLLDGEPAAAPATSAPSTTTTAPPVAFADREPVLSPLRLALPAPPALDPATADPLAVGDLVAADLLYDGLTAWDESAGSVVPALAARWQSSPDGLTWTFRLRAGATFSDGTPVTADDVVRTLARAVSVGEASLVAGSLDSVAGWAEVASGSTDTLAGVTALDARTVEVALTRPTGDLPELLSSPLLGVVPPGDPVGAVGSGPYVVGEQDGRLLALAPVDDDERPAVLVVTEDPVGAVAAGRADLAPAGAGDATTAGQVVTAEGDATVFLGVDLRRRSLPDPLLRAAILASLDRDALAPLLPGGPWAATDSLVPVSWGGQGCGPTCDHDPGTARTLAGGAAASGEVLLVAVPGAAYEAVGAAVVDSLLAAGIPAELAVLEPPVFADRLAAGELDVFLHAAVVAAPSPLALLRPFASWSPANVTGYVDAETDALLAAAELTTADEDVAAVEERILGTAVVAPLARLERRWVLGPAAAAVTVRHDGTVSFR